MLCNGYLCILKTKNQAEVNNMFFVLLEILQLLENSHLK